MADEIDDDLLMSELLSLGEPQGEPEPEPAYQPIGPRLYAPRGRPDAGQYGRSLLLKEQENDKLMQELISLGNPDGGEITVTRPELFQSGDPLIDDVVADHARRRKLDREESFFESVGRAYREWTQQPSGHLPTQPDEATQHGEFYKGLVRGATGAVSVAGSGLQHLGEQAERNVGPASDTTWMQTFGADVAKRTGDIRKSREYAGRVERMGQIRKEQWFKDAVDYVVGAVGEGFGSIGTIALTTIATGGVGLIPSLYLMSTGEVRQQLEQEGVDPKEHGNLISAAGAVHASLEYIPGFKTMMGALSSGTKAEVNRAILKSVAGGFVKGGTREGVTEGLQTGIELAAGTYAKTGSAMDVAERLGSDVGRGAESEIIEAAVKGFLPGGILEGGARGVGATREARARSGGQTATDAELESADSATAIGSFAGFRREKRS